MKFDKTKFNEFSIRVPEELTELIQKDAELLKRSRNMQVVAILEDYYRDNYRQPERDQKVVQDIAAQNL